MRQHLLWALGVAILMACQPTDPSSLTGDATTDSFTVPNPPPAECGDAFCDGTLEDTANCPDDCGSWCGDGACNGTEAAAFCPQDCDAPPATELCGDGSCGDGEDTVNCVVDCGSWCGDSACNGPETTALCPQDCDNTTPPNTCGDGLCKGDESTANCPADCGDSTPQTTCGDGSCNGNESSATCPADCGAPPPQTTCGDGTCNGNENASSCPQDCNQSFPAPTTNNNPNVHGFVDAVSTNQGSATVNGWTCHMGQDAPIEVHIFVGGDVTSGTFLKAKLADNPNEQAVNDACQAGGSHRYEVTLSAADVSAHAGEAVYAYGVGAQGSALLANSGKFHLPGGTTVTNPNLPFDLNAVTWLHVNVSNWPVTANLSSVTFSGGNICLNYDKANSWPSVSIPHSSGNGNVDVVANPWVFVQHGGKWYAGTWEWLAVGKTCRNIKAVAGDHIKQNPLKNWKPTSGETLYFMVGALSRFSHIKNVSERSNIVKVIWP